MIAWLRIWVCFTRFLIALQTRCATVRGGRSASTSISQTPSRAANADTLRSETMRCEQVFPDRALHSRRLLTCLCRETTRVRFGLVSLSVALGWLGFAGQFSSAHRSLSTVHRSGPDA